MNRFCVCLLLSVAGVAIQAFADDLVPIQVPPEFPIPCPELPDDAVPVDYVVLETFRLAGPRSVVLSMPGDSDSKLPAGLLERTSIDSADEYRAIFDENTGEVDFDQSRILVLEEYVSYRHGRLDGESRFSGVYRFGETLIIRTTYNNHGPCQGIAQDPAWFSFESNFLLLVIPREPTEISYSLCRIGDCPPDIP